VRKPDIGLMQVLRVEKGKQKTDLDLCQQTIIVQPTNYKRFSLPGLSEQGEYGITF